MEIEFYVTPTTVCVETRYGRIRHTTQFLYLTKGEALDLLAKLKEWAEKEGK